MSSFQNYTSSPRVYGICYYCATAVFSRLKQARRNNRCALKCFFVVLVELLGFGIIMTIQSNNYLITIILSFSKLTVIKWVLCSEKRKEWRWSWEDFSWFSFYQYLLVFLRFLLIYFVLNNFLYLQSNLSIHLFPIRWFCMIEFCQTN